MIAPQKKRNKMEALTGFVIVRVFPLLRPRHRSDHRAPGMTSARIALYFGHCRGTRIILLLGVSFVKFC